MHHRRDAKAAQHAVNEVVVGDGADNLKISITAG